MVHEICETAIVLREAVSAADLVLQDVQKLTSLQETRGMSLPVQRETGDIKIAWGNFCWRYSAFMPGKPVRYSSRTSVKVSCSRWWKELVTLSSIAEEMRVGKKKSWTLIPDSSSKMPIRYITSRSLTADHTLPDEENKMDHRRLVDECNWMYHNMTCALCWIGIKE
ncbi:hypothetical protein MAR_004841 [Mya arenaria]|uniref:Uncharacterized protein n=1 Tax=Mya arenaria TaxID=6604 RepID=A0ABY7F1J8_MYAAR|nr:hypothetical protein MAR_004841 [Mya arenaria]